MATGKIGQPPVELQQSNKIEDTSSAIDIRTVNVYDFVDHAYNSCAGFRDGTYLTPHPREAFYNTRRKSCYYINAYKPVINAMVNPVFKETAVRETSSEAFEEFIANADNAGTPLQSITKTVLCKARRAGIAFVVVDNVPKSVIATANTEEQAIAFRALPYAYVKNAQDMYEMQCDKYGRMESISLCDGVHKVENTEYKKYRYWDKTTWVEFYIKGSGASATKITLDEGSHGLGVIPVIPVNPFVENQSLLKMPEPPYYDLALLSWALFNKESLVVTLEQNQSFSIFYVSGFDQKNLSVGPTNFFSCTDAAKFPPGFASPDAQHIRNLVDNCNRLEERIRSLAQQNGVIGVVKQSGIAKEWDFRAEEAVLVETATAATNLEYAIHDLFDLYRNSASKYAVKYPSRFSPTYATERIDQAMNVLDRQPPEAIRNELWNEVAEVMWAAQDERLENVKAANELDAESEAQSDTEAGLPPEDMLPPDAVPAPKADTAAALTDATAGGANVSATALNGAQVESLLSIVAAVTGKQMPIESAKSILAAAFPMVDSAVVDSIIDPLRTYEPRVVDNGNVANP